MPNQTEESSLIAVVDAGTTGIKSVLFDEQGEIVSSSYAESKSYYPKPGWVEQDANEIVRLAFEGMRKAVSGVDCSRIAGLCITAQRNTWVPIDKDGVFLRNMFIWQDQRGEEVLPWMREQLEKAGLTQDDFYRVIGQPFSTFQPGSKTFWYRLNQPELYAKTWKFVTPHDFLSHEFGAESYADSLCDISSWMVADGTTFTFDSTFMQAFGMDSEKYTQHVAPGTRLGVVSEAAAKKSGLPAGIPIFAAAADQECCVLGVGNYGADGIAAISAGTACNVVGYSKTVPRHPDGVCQVHGHPAGGYDIEAHTSSCTASFNWMRNIVLPKGSGSDDASENSYEAISKMILDSAVGANGVLFFPWMQGAGCPYFDDDAHGCLIGMTLATRKEDLLRACVEGVCFEIRNLLDSLQKSDIAPIECIRVTGGTSRNAVWNQIMADVMGRPVETVTATEATALGAAITGFVGAGVFDSYQQASEQMCHVQKAYLPNKENSEKYDQLFAVWKKGYGELSRTLYPELRTFQDGQ